MGIETGFVTAKVDSGREKREEPTDQEANPEGDFGAKFAELSGEQQQDIEANLLNLANVSMEELSAASPDHIKAIWPAVEQYLNEPRDLSNGRTMEKNPNKQVLRTKAVNAIKAVV